ncbi:meiotic recombination protein SPO11 isoform X1 [Corvus kubaryi]|uniref:meiotic recombination protein SPO11 isoform X1 n=1 Tax=Corvus kubaryi TaxID=68294 RepID=UPI001C053222|nr:meiotic recombination protein SPO11 isoform X1 [Corvus kubaryi]XP_041901342.1 meiotic recombination protein SPO11 isoform X1 [Corvus kubaryi]
MEEHDLCSTEMPAGNKASFRETSQSGQESHVPSSEVLEAIENVIQGVLQSLAQKKAPVLTVANRTDWRNIEFKDSVGLQMIPRCTTKQIRSDCPQSAKRFALMLKILSMIYKMVQSNTYATKRDVYYSDTLLFGSQSVVDQIINDISCMLKIPRRSLHVAVTVPSNVQGIKNLTSHAKFILIVEKDATFQRLLDDDFFNKVSPCIMITGRGIPDLNTRLLVRKLWDSFQIPVFTLMDADPHGVEIMCVYKYGSVSMSFEAHHLTVPSIKWLGLLPSDLKRLNICKDALIPFTKQDENKLASIQKRPYIACQPLWKKELEIMAASKLKAEIQVLTSLSSDYLSRVYLPNKLQFGGWL